MKGKPKDDSKSLDKDPDRVPHVTSIHPELKKKESAKKQNTKTCGPSTGKQYVNPNVKTEDDDMLHIMDFPTPDSTLSSNELPRIIDTSGSCLSWIFWEHENLSGLSIIRLIQLL